MDSGSPEQLDIGEYCRRVEEHLTRVNQGHLVRIVGTSFELVRAWAREGIPLGIVFRGIERKAERHRAGASKRPLRLEFCEGDVRALYDDWRRAVGMSALSGQDGGASAEGSAIDDRRRPSLVRQIDRAIDRIVAAVGRLETPEVLRESLGDILDRLSSTRDELRHARGDVRAALIARVVAIDREIADAARRAVVSMASVEAEAAADLAPFRARLSPDAWQRSLDAAVDCLLRERFGLPTLDLSVPTGP